MGLFVSLQAHALVNLESLILGDLSATNLSKETDPLFNVFQSSRSKVGKDGDRERIALYRGFIDEGENLELFCKNDRNQKLRYPSTQQYEQATRTIVSTLQYIGIDLLVRAIPEYAKQLDFTDDEFEKLSQSLVGNWCSQNLTVVSHKTLKRNFIEKWKSDERFTLPDIKDNAFFSQKLTSIANKDEKLSREFFWTVELFKSFCSWSNTTENFRLLVPLLRDPIIMSFVARQMDNKKLEFNPRSQSLSLVTERQTTRVACRGIICRKADDAEFRRLVPRAIGSPSVNSDMRRLYCDRLTELGVNYNDPDPRIKKLLDDRTLEENLLLAGQFKALITGIPNFFIWSESYDQAQGILRTSFDQSWTDWANNSIESLKGNLTYEEPLTVELVERDYFFNKYIKKFEVHFDVNQGEFDRVNKVLGKLAINFDLKISHKMIKWIRRNWVSYDPTMKLERRDMINKFKAYIKDDVEKARSTFIIPPWKGDIEEIIAVELLEQFSKFIGDWSYPEEGFTTIPVYLHYGPFALRLMRYRYLVSEKAKTLSKHDEKEGK